MEKTPVNNMHSLAALLGLNDVPFTVVIGRPPKGSKSMKVKNFGKRIQKGK